MHSANDRTNYWNKYMAVEEPENPFFALFRSTRIPKLTWESFPLSLLANLIVPNTWEFAKPYPISQRISSSQYLILVQNIVPFQGLKHHQLLVNY